MLGSNQRPLPCESRSITSWLFAGVQKYLQINGFLGGILRVCSPMFARVGVLLVNKRTYGKFVPLLYFDFYLVG